MKQDFDRRSFLGLSATAAATMALGAGPRAANAQQENAAPNASPARRWQNGASPWPICLDTATIRPASLVDKVRIAREAGYDAIEPWEGELHKFEQEGGSLKELGQKIRDAGMFVPSVIGLWNAIPATREAFGQSLIDSRRRMRQAAELGAEHVQVVSQPARPWAEFDPKWAAERYRELLEIGLNEFNINPALVFVEFLPGIARLGQAAAVAIDADHPKAKIIPDVFHMYIGDSGFHGLKHIRGDFIAIFQINDAPAHPPKAQLKDEHRVYPGDGIFDLPAILRDLKTIAYTGCVSVELYNPTYWSQDLQTVARTGLQKTLAVIAQAGV